MRYFIPLLRYDVTLPCEMQNFSIKCTLYTVREISADIKVH